MNDLVNQGDATRKYDGENGIRSLRTRDGPVDHPLPSIVSHKTHGLVIIPKTMTGRGTVQTTTIVRIIDAIVTILPRDPISNNNNKVDRNNRKENELRKKWPPLPRRRENSWPSTASFTVRIGLQVAWV